jgi:hypothetical protein
MLRSLRQVAVNNWILILISISLLLFAFNVAVFYPGYMSTDSVNHLNEALRLTPLTDLQPPAEPLLWRLLIDITGHISAMLVFQLTLLWSALFLIALFIYRKTSSRKLSLAPLVVGLLPFVLNISGVIWSDNQMAFCLLLATSIGLYLSEASNKKIRIGLFVAALVLVLYACIVRYNAFFAIVPLLFMLVHQSCLFGKIKYQVISTVMLLIFAGITMLLVKNISNAYHVSSTTGFKLDDVVHVYSEKELKEANINENAKSILIKIDRCTNSKNIVIDSYWNCPEAVKRNELLTVYSSDVSKEWSNIFTHKPAQYVLYKIEAFTLVLFPQEGHHYIWQPGIIENDLGLEPELATLGNTIGIYVNNFGYKHFSFLFEPWFWLVANIVLFIYGVRRQRYVLIFVCVSLSAILYICGFAPTGVAVDYRYIYWPVLSGSTLALLAVADRLKTSRIKKAR